MAGNKTKQIGNGWCDGGLCQKSGSSNRAQVATEYLILVAVSLVIIAAVAGYSFILYNETISSSMAKQALGGIKEGVKKAHSLGDGSRFPIEVTFPQNITDVSFTNNAILVTTNFFGISSTEVIEFDSNVSGNITISEGLHRIIVENIEGEVILSEA